MKRKFFQISSFKDLTWEDISMSLTANLFVHGIVKIDIKFKQEPFLLLIQQELDRHTNQKYWLPFLQQSKIHDQALAEQSLAIHSVKP